MLKYKYLSTRIVAKIVIIFKQGGFDLDFNEVLKDFQD
jgi:hypothetical protein